MKIGLLTSSRADYGIYFPLITKLKNEEKIDLEIIAFGTHLSEKHGYTIDEILNDGFEVKHSLSDCFAINDTPQGISKALARTISIFSDFWSENSYDLVFALGDRYEMFAAVTSGVSFQVKFAHLYGGETTLGAIDNCFRHSISHMSYVHFVSCENYKNRLIELIGSDDLIVNAGSLSVDNIRNMNFLSDEDLKQQFNIDVSIPTILCTLHSETTNFEQTSKQAHIICQSLSRVENKQIVITMPNSDTSNNCIREVFSHFASTRRNVILRENLGRLGYLSLMKKCEFVLGNSSSGFVEAATLKKKVINIGKRQEGRILTPNIITSSFDEIQINESIQLVENQKEVEFDSNFYGEGDTASKIISYLFSLNLIQG